jgi:hypothetical protein
MEQVHTGEEWWHAPVGFGRPLPPGKQRLFARGDGGLLGVLAAAAAHWRLPLHTGARVVHSGGVRPLPPGAMASSGFVQGGGVGFWGLQRQSHAGNNHL